MDYPNVFQKSFEFAVVSDFNEMYSESFFAFEKEWQILIRKRDVHGNVGIYLKTLGAIEGHDSSMCILSFSLTLQNEVRNKNVIKKKEGAEFEGKNDWYGWSNFIENEPFFHPYYGFIHDGRVVIIINMLWINPSDNIGPNYFFEDGAVNWQQLQIQQSKLRGQAEWAEKEEAWQEREAEAERARMRRERDREREKEREKEREEEWKREKQKEKEREDEWKKKTGGGGVSPSSYPLPRISGSGANGMIAFKDMHPEQYRRIVEDQNGHMLQNNSDGKVQVILWNYYHSEYNPVQLAVDQGQAALRRIRAEVGKVFDFPIFQFQNIRLYPMDEEGLRMITREDDDVFSQREIMLKFRYDGDIQDHSEAYESSAPKVVGFTHSFVHIGPFRNVMEVKTLTLADRSTHPVLHGKVTKAFGLEAESYLLHYYSPASYCFGRVLRDCGDDSFHEFPEDAVFYVEMRSDLVGKNDEKFCFPIFVVGNVPASFRYSLPSPPPSTSSSSSSSSSSTTTTTSSSSPPGKTSIPLPFSLHMGAIGLVDKIRTKIATAIRSNPLLQDLRSSFMLSMPSLSSLSVSDRDVGIGLRLQCTVQGKKERPMHYPERGKYEKAKTWPMCEHVFVLEIK